MSGTSDYLLNSTAIDRNQTQPHASSRSFYDAFISYSHAADGTLALMLQRALERYAIPWYRHPTLRIFRDETNLSATPHAWPTIQTNLDRAGFLILMASPEASASKWVRKELAHWLTTKSPETLLIVLTAGTITWDDVRCDFDWDRTTALPDILRGKFQDEPLHVDLRNWGKAPGELTLRNDHFADKVLRLAAPLHGKPMDELSVQAVREVTRRIRHARIAVALIIALAIAASAAAIVAEQRKTQAEREGRVAIAQALAAQAAESRPNTPLPSLLLAAQAVKTTTALREPVVPAAEQALRDSLAAIGGLVLHGHTGPVTRVTASPDSRWAITASKDTTARIWDLQAADPSTTSIALTGHTGEIDQLAISGDSKRLVTADSDRQIRVWDLPPASSPSARFVLSTGHKGNAVCISPDGRWIVAASGSKVKYWDLTSAEPTKAQELGTDGAAISALSLDARFLVTGDSDGTIKVWTFPPAKNVASRVYASPNDSFTEKPVSMVRLTDDGRWLLAGNVGGTVGLWDLTSAKRTPVAKMKQEGVAWHDIDFKIVSLTMNSKSGRIAAVQFNGLVRLYQLTKNNTVKATRTFQERGEVKNGAMSQDGKWLIIGSEHGGARLLPLGDHPTDPSGFRLRGHESYVNATAVTNDNKWAITGSSDDNARLWRMEPLTPSAQPITLAVAVKDSHNRLDIAAISPDASTIAVSGEMEQLRLFRLATTFPESLTRLHEQTSLNPGVLSAIAFGGSAHRFVTGDSLGEVSLWNLEGAVPTKVSVGKLEYATITALAIGRDQRFVAAGASMRGVRIWDLADRSTPAKPRELHGVVTPSTVTISPDNRWLVTGGDEVFIHGLAADNASEKQISTAAASLRQTSATFSADGLKLAVAFGQTPGTTTFVGAHKLPPQGIVRVWNVGSQGVSDDPLVLNVPQASLTSVGLSRQGHWLVAGGTDGNVRLWDLRTAKSEQFLLLRGGNARVLKVAVTPDEKFVIAYSEDETVRIWRLPVEDLLELAKRHVSRNLSEGEWNTFQSGRPRVLTFPELESPRQ
jgi:WD40 repeat protein